MARAAWWLLLGAYCLAVGAETLHPKLNNTGIDEATFNPPIPVWKLDPYSPRAGRIGAGLAAADVAYLSYPSQDPWYSAPDGWEAATPGSVLKVRHHAYNNTAGLAIPHARDTFQVLFRSTNSQKNATWAVTTVFLPANPRCTNSTLASNCTQPILSYQLPYDTSCLDASPSFGLQFGEPYGEIAAALARGWWVSVPDYEGPLASYGANIVAGYITLDSARAVVNVSGSTEYGMRHARVALWGYSNGASATETAAEFAAAYAPGLQLAGAAIGGLAPDVAAAGPQLSQTQVAGLLVQGLIGVTSQYPEQRAYLVSRLNPSGPYNGTEFFWASYMSGWQSLLYFCYVDIFAYFIGGQADLQDVRIVNMFLKEGTLGRFGLPNTKMFVYHALDDDMAPIKDTDALVERFCGDGANVLYHRNHWGGHNDELTNGRQRALDFLGDVLDGTNILSAPATGCQTVDVTFMQDPNTPIA
ncbi:secretory lipase-domain-containing protein [Lasiosphaeria miniovina]|uniref:Secretory lipase-domain-containing protein n=1 Tax=Lasiosphaeria miniovina TaxID=1954250 RepID=A0AA40DRQ3_9PEZI|nr:secretory lipase-domain-containing protein [Lasiosphaeria miniovina]KAK0713719.1 secretory lipase-domain-containing protein [Lasiosphaeria miniovina]